jgi:hypothetical protein
MFQALKHIFHVLELVFPGLEHKLLLGEKHFVLGRETFYPRGKNFFILKGDTFCLRRKK